MVSNLHVSFIYFSMIFSTCILICHFFVLVSIHLVFYLSFQLVLVFSLFLNCGLCYHLKNYTQELEFSTRLC